MYLPGSAGRMRSGPYNGRGSEHSADAVELVLEVAAPADAERGRDHAAHVDRAVPDVQHRPSVRVGGEQVAVVAKRLLVHAGG